MRPIILVPGYTGSGPDHWQTHWHKAYPSSLRVEVPDWDDPDLEIWVDALDKLVLKTEESPVIAAHSLGCYVVAHWAQRYDREISGALLVAPPDLDREDQDVPLKVFAPAPLEPLPFSTTVVASSDDPFSTIQRAEWIAEQWGANFESLGPAGHVNTVAGFGPWPEGEHYLRQLVSTPKQPRLRSLGAEADAESVYSDFVI